MRLSEKTVLITGAASGMGRLAAEMFAKEGAQIVATDMNVDVLQETVQSVESAGGSIVGVPGNVTDSESVREAVAVGVKTFGRLDVLYNNAGIFPDDDTSVVETEDEVFQRVIDVNLKGVWNACKYGIPELVKAGGGSVINIASFVALAGCTVPQDAYTASKGGVLSLTKSLAVQYGPNGVRANAICPGPILTPMLETLFPSEEEKNKRLDRIPLGRFGRAEDIVYAGMYLASDESSWTTGTTFVVDGGITVNYF
jgi:NAD(P)-dependent dehydrogenase (short-subunit alcohol dehydrogenase family)